MATEFTPNYNLDKYTAEDKPNLRDQYNAAMDKIDAALLSANTNATEAKAATQSFAGDIAAKADQTDLDALSAILPAAQFSSQNTVKAALDAKASQISLNSLAALLPAQSFSEQNTILDALNSKASATKKKLIIIGDSWSTPNTTHQVAVYWYDMLASFLNMDAVTYAVGGTGFVVGGQNTFYNQLQRVKSDYTADQIGMIIVFGGTNDIGSYNYSGTVTLEQFRANVNVLLDDLQASYPYVPKIVAGCNRNMHSFRVESLNYDKTALWSWYLGLDAVKKSRCAFRNFSTVGPFDNNFYISDSDSHPSADGMRAIMQKMLNSDRAFVYLNWSADACVITNETMYNLDIQQRPTEKGVHIAYIGSGIPINANSLVYFRNAPYLPQYTPIFDRTLNKVFYLSTSGLDNGYSYFNNRFKIGGTSDSDYSGTHFLYMEHDIII